MLDRAAVVFGDCYTNAVSGSISQRFESLARREQLLPMSFTDVLGKEETILRISA